MIEYVKAVCFSMSRLLLFGGRVGSKMLFTLLDSSWSQMQEREGGWP